MPCLDDPFSGGDMEFREVFMEHTPIAAANTEAKQHLSCLAERIQTAKQTDSHANTAKLERLIDDTVYTLYGLNSPEIAVIEDVSP